MTRFEWNFVTGEVKAYEKEPSGAILGREARSYQWVTGYFYYEDAMLDRNLWQIAKGDGKTLEEFFRDL